MKTKALSTIMAMVLGAGLVASAVAAPSHSYQDLEVKVNYADLDIDNEAGAKVLYRRLKHASAEVCGYTRWQGARHVSNNAKAKLCYKKTLTKAVQQIGSTTLDKIHDG